MVTGGAARMEECPALLKWVLSGALRLDTAGVLARSPTLLHRLDPR